jgi:phosphoglycolate phosphatase
MNILIDFDGTIIDSSNRMFLLFDYLVPESQLSKNEYWALKRSKASHSDILGSQFGWNHESIVQFDVSWHRLIESDSWLSLDSMKKDVMSHLGTLRESANLYVVTARQDRSRLLGQLCRFEIHSLFTDVYVTEQKATKYALVRHLDLTASDWFVGDTGHDVLVGKQLGVQTAAVSDGFLGEDALREYNPDLICKSFTAFHPMRNT